MKSHHQADSSASENDIGRTVPVLAKAACTLGGLVAPLAPGSTVRTVGTAAASVSLVANRDHFVARPAPIP